MQQLLRWGVWLLLFWLVLGVRLFSCLSGPFNAFWTVYKVPGRAEWELRWELQCSSCPAP